MENSFFADFLTIPAIFISSSNFEDEIRHLAERNLAFDAFAQGEITLEDILDLIEWQGYDCESYANLVEERVKNFLKTGGFLDDVDINVNID